MNILLITYGWDPRQADDGGQQRTHLLWKALGNIGNVYTLIISDAEMGDAVNIKCFNPYVEDKPYSCGKNILHRLKSFVGYVLFWKTGLSFCSYTERAEIADIFPGVHFDSIVCRYFKVLLYVNVYRIAPVYVDIDDYPLTLFDTLLCRQRKLSRIGCCFWRNILKLELFWHSRHWIGAWVADKSDIGKVGTKNNTILLSNIPYNIYSNIDHSSQRTMLFMIGGAYHTPNVIGVTYFLSHIWPAVHERFPQLKFLLVGRGWEKIFAERLQDVPNVEYVGFVEDLAMLYSRCLATVVPVNSGAGTCIKTLESLANKRVCISTPFGARGLPGDKEALARNGVMIYNNAEEFVAVLSKMIASPEWLAEREKAARDFIDGNYSAAVFNAQVYNLLQ